jgi:DNA-binding CsgD family transcriptional regulator
MDAQLADARASFAALAGQWTRQVQTFRRSVSLYRDVDCLRARRLRAAAAWPAPTGEQRPGGERRAHRPTPAPEVEAAAVAPRAACPLTPRQLEVVQLIAEGLTNGQIANRLVLTPGTVANHVEHILRRLEVPNRAAAATWLVGEYAGRRRQDDEGRARDERG